MACRVAPIGGHQHKSTRPLELARGALTATGRREFAPGSSGDELTTAARQAQKSTASQDETRQASTGDGAGDGTKGQIDLQHSRPFAAFAVHQLEREVSGRSGIGGYGCYGRGLAPD